MIDSNHRQQALYGSHRLQGPRARAGEAVSGSRAANFLLTHLWIPLVVFVVLASALFLLDGDGWWADRLYAWEGHRWVLRSVFVTEQLVHKAGHTLSVIAWVCVLVAWIVARMRRQLAHLRRPLGYLVLSVLVATTLVAWFKSWSNMDCPWDLLRYGGDRPYVALLHLRPIGLARGACFPAGHASAGYAWMALYFFFLVVRPQWRWWGLAAGAGSGLLFGIAQQLRGAHFLSHDLWTAAICWMTVFAVFQVLYNVPLYNVPSDAGDAARDGHDAPPRAQTQTDAPDKPWALAP